MDRLYSARSETFLALACLPLALALSGCGGAGTTSSSGSGTEIGPAHTTTDSAEQPKGAATSESSRNGANRVVPIPPARAFVPRHHHDSGGGAAQFIVKGADNSVQESGSEATEAELKAAATALHGFLDARAERNWAAACAYLSEAAKQSISEPGAGGRRRSCAATLAALSGKVPSATLREAALADVGSLRREGRNGFLIYRGAPKGTVYAISIAKQGGDWKIASLAGTPLN